MTGKVVRPLILFVPAPPFRSVIGRALVDLRAHHSSLENEEHPRPPEPGEPTWSART